MWGRTVASRIGSGGWPAPASTPAAATYPDGRTAATTWAVDTDGSGPANPDPLTGSVTDPAGTITTKMDLLGRTVSYTDTLGTVTTTAYDTLGLVSSTSSTPAGFPTRARAFT